MHFYLNGYKDCSSKFGGCMTLLLYIITIVIGVILAKDLIIKNNPKVNISTVYSKPAKIFYPDNIVFMVSMSIDSVPFVDEKIYRAFGQIKTKINGTQETLTTKNITLDLCNNVFDKTHKFYDSIKDINLSNFYCISLDKNKEKGIKEDEYFLNEFWGKDGFQMLQIKIYNCSAIAKNKEECASYNIMKQILNSPIITYYTLKNYVDTNNYTNPYVRGIQEIFYYVSYKKYISSTVYLKNIEVHSDIGLLFSEEEIKADSTIDSIVDFSTNDPEDGKLFTITLQLTNKKDIYNRTYYKIQDLGAEIGAIYGVIHIIFAILMEFYNTSKLFTSVMNNFFLIKEEYKPLNKDKKTFIGLRKKFYKDLRFNVSFGEKISTNSRNNRIKNSTKSLNSDNIKKPIPSYEEISNIILNKNDLMSRDILNKNINISSKNSIILKMINKKKEEEKKKMKIKFSYVDKLLCLYIISLCKNKTNKLSYYNLFFKGKDYLMKY